MCAVWKWEMHLNGENVMWNENVDVMHVYEVVYGKLATQWNVAVGEWGADEDGVSVPDDVWGTQWLLINSICTGRDSS